MTDEANEAEVSPFAGIHLSPYQSAWLNRQKRVPEVPEPYVPVVPFYWTIDQIAHMLQLTVQAVQKKCYFLKRSTGVRSNDLMLAVNIATKGERPDWRVEDKEFRRWLWHRGIVIYPPYAGRLSTPPDEEGESQ